MMPWVTTAAAANGLGLLDWAILGGYLLICLAIGWWSMRQIRDAGAYLLARRKLGKVMSLAATFAGGVNANDPVSVTSKVYVDGVSGVWTALNFLLLAPWFWMRDPVGRRVRLVTSIDVLELRYGPALAWTAIVVGMFAAVANLGLGIKAAAQVATGVSGGNEVMAVISITGDPATDAKIIASAIVVVPTLIYTVMGGIIAACATDVFMSLLIIVLSFVVIPFAWVTVGGLEAMRAGLPKGHLNILSTDADFTVWGILWFIIGWTFALVPAPSAARDEMTARIGSTGILIKRFCTLGWGAIGLFGVVLYAQQNGHTTEFGDTVFARISVDLLPMGLRGLMVAAIMAAAMSTISSMALSFSGMVLHNLYRPLLMPKAHAAHYLLVARILTVVILLTGGMLAVVNTDDVFTFFSNMALVGSLMGMCTLAAYMWRRVTAAGAIASVLIMAPPVVIAFGGGKLNVPWDWTWDWFRVVWIKWLEFHEWGYAAAGIESVRLVRTAEGLISGSPLAIRFPAQLIPGLIALVSVSLLTRQHNPRHVREFYARLDTPVGEEHRLVEAGIEVDMLRELGSDADVTTHDPSKRLLMLDLLYLPWLLARGEARLSDYKMDFIGIAVLGAFVAAFMAGMLWLVSLLRPVAMVGTAWMGG